MFRRYKIETAVFILLTALYLSQTLFTKPDPSTLSRYHLTASSAHILGLTIAIPYIMIWFVALVGYLRLKSYLTLIADSRDGAAFRQITAGILWIALFLPISTILTNATNNYALRHHSVATQIRIVNYINVLLVFMGIWLIFQGSVKLLALVKSSQVINTSTAYQWATVGYLAFTAIYVMLVLHDPTRQFPSKSVKIAGYYESDWWLTTTIIIPRLITWYLALRAALNIYFYRKKINGTLYREALKNLAFGISGATISIVVLRCIQTLAVSIGRLSLGFLLALVYALLILISIGYIYIAMGAKKLQKLEEI